MGVDLARQLHILSGAALLGVAVGLLFVAVRVVGFFLHGAFWRFTLDLLRVFGAVVLNFAYFQQHADGQARWYDLGVEILAGWLFYISIGRFLVKMSCFLISYVAAFLKKLLQFLWRPVRCVLALAARGGRFLVKITTGFLKKVFIFLYRYIIMIISPIFQRRKKKRKESASNGKAEEKEQGNIPRFYH